MVEEAVKRKIFRLFADILEYPRESVMDSVLECESLLPGKDIEAGTQLGKFRDFIENMSVAQLQEVYTVTFDMNAAYQPYVGYHLFGESYKRSIFMVELKKHYRANGFVIENNELPDHIVVLLYFVATCNDEDMSREIACEALVPALEKMLGKNKQVKVSENNIKKNEPKNNRVKKQQSSPYEHVLLALWLTILQHIE